MQSTCLPRLPRLPRLVLVLVTLGLLGVVASTVGCSSDEGRPSGSSGSSLPSPDSGGADGGSGKSALAASCTANEECESNICFLGGNQSFCSLRCTVENVATVCVAPLTGSCNKQGYCKRD